MYQFLWKIKHYCDDLSPVYNSILSLALNLKLPLIFLGEGKDLYKITWRELPVENEINIFYKMKIIIYCYLFWTSESYTRYNLRQLWNTVKQNIKGSLTLQITIRNKWTWNLKTWIQSILWNFNQTFKFWFFFHRSRGKNCFMRCRILVKFHANKKYALSLHSRIFLYFISIDLRRYMKVHL